MINSFILYDIDKIGNIVKGEHSGAAAALEKTLALGRTSPGAIDWVVGHQYHGEQVSVEIASYVLLSYGHNLPESIDDALPVFRGITRQLSESGGFKSTQDTVVGIQGGTQFLLEVFNNYFREEF